MATYGTPAQLALAVAICGFSVLAWKRWDRMPIPARAAVFLGLAALLVVIGVEWLGRDDSKAVISFVYAGILGVIIAVGLWFHFASKGER